MTPIWRRYRERASGLLAQLVLGAILFVALYQTLCHAEAFADDAAITFSYSRHLAETGELIHTASSERVEGFSNPTWTMLCAIPFLLHMDPYIFARTIAVLCLIATIMLVYRSARRLCPRSAAARYAAPLLFALTPCVAFWTMAGLETPLIAFLLAALIDQTLLEEREGRHQRSGLILAALALSRPEGLIYAAPVALYKASMLLHRPAGERARLLRLHGVNLLGLVIPVVAFLTWRRLYFSAWLPNTFWAKLTAIQLQPTDATDETRGMRYVRGFFRLNNLWPLVYASPLALLVRERWAEAIFLLAMAGTHLGFVLAVDGDWMGDFRFFAFAMPIYSLVLGLALQGAADLLRWPGGWLRRPRGFAVAGGVLATGLLLAFLVTSLLPTLTEYRRAGWVSMELVRRQGAGLEVLARRLGLVQASVALPDVGGSALSTNIRVIDTAGLVDPVLARHKGRADRVRRYLFEEVRPDFYQQHSHWGRYYNLPSHFEFQRDYVELPTALAKRLVLLGKNYIRREHLTASPGEIEHPARGELGRGLILRGYDSPLRIGDELLIQLFVESRGEQLEAADWVEIRLLPEAEDRQGTLLVELASLPPDLFEPGALIRLRFSTQVRPVEALQVLGVQREETPPAWPVKVLTAGHVGGASLERLIRYPRTHLVCAFPPRRPQAVLEARGRRQIFDGCRPRHRPEEVRALTGQLRARASAALELGLIEPAVLLLDRAELLEPRSRLIHALQRRVAEAAYRRALVEARRGDLEAARRLVVAALRAEPLLSRARALDDELTTRGAPYFADRRERADTALERLRRHGADRESALEALEATLAADRPEDGARALEALGDELLLDPELALLAGQVDLALGLCEQTLERLEASPESGCARDWLAFRAASLCGREASRPGCPPPRSAPLSWRSIFELEDEALDGWELSSPLGEPEELPTYYTSGFSGVGLLRSDWIEGGVPGAFRARSPEFTIDREALSVQVAGGFEEDGVRLALVVDGREVRQGAGQRDLHLRRLTWDVSDLVGRRARLLLVDEGGDAEWGRLLIDHVRAHSLHDYDPDRPPSPEP